MKTNTKLYTEEEAKERQRQRNNKYYAANRVEINKKRKKKIQDKRKAEKDAIWKAYKKKNKLSLF